MYIHLDIFLFKEPKRGHLAPEPLTSRTRQRQKHSKKNHNQNPRSPQTTAQGRTTSTKQPEDTNERVLQAGTPSPPAPGGFHDPLAAFMGGPRVPFVPRGLGVGTARGMTKGAWGRRTAVSGRALSPGGDAPAGCGSRTARGAQECIIGAGACPARRAADGRGFQCSPPSSSGPGRASAAWAVCSAWPLPRATQQPLPPCHLLQRDRALFSPGIYC